jgi:putative phosphoribosyl transferase
MTPLFVDRADAGRQLAGQLRHLAGRQNLIILGLPRGGVPVAFQVARALGGQLDVFVVRKLGVPGHEELAMGAVASGGVRVINAETVSGLGISPHSIEQVTTTERRELERRERAFRGDRPFPDLKNATVILVDDGVATGSTMLAAVRALRQQHPAFLVAAAPVMSESAQTALASEVDDCVSVATPEPFLGVGAWYDDFEQTSDAEVLGLLDRARSAPGRHGVGAPGGPLAQNPGKVVGHAFDS